MGGGECSGGNGYWRRVSKGQRTAIKYPICIRLHVFWVNMQNGEDQESIKQVIKLTCLFIDSFASHWSAPVKKGCKKYFQWW